MCNNFHLQALCDFLSIFAQQVLFLHFELEQKKVDFDAGLQRMPQVFMTSQSGSKWQHSPRHLHDLILFYFIFLHKLDHESTRNLCFFALFLSKWGRDVEDILLIGNVIIANVKY